MQSLDLSKVNVEDFLDALECENVSRATDDEFLFSCPFPGHTHGDETPSAYMNTESTAWFCHSCKRRGNAITFLAEHENISRYLATVFLRAEYDASFKEPEGGSFAAEWDAHFATQAGAKPTSAPVYLDESIQDEFFALDWPLGYITPSGQLPEPMEYMLGRGFSPQTLNDWGIGYDDRSDRITIPVREVDDRLVGFKGRATRPDQMPRYLIMGDRPNRPDRGYGFRPYNVGKTVFGLDRAQQQEELILVEGELNVIAMHQMGFTNTIALGGSYVSPRHAEQIKWHADRLILFYDSHKEEWDDEEEEFFIVPDKAGLKATLDSIQVFEGSMPVRVVDEHVGDPADYLQAHGTENAREVVSDLLETSASSLHVSMDF